VAQVQDSQEAAEMERLLSELGHQTAPGEIKTLAVVAANSYERLMRDVAFIGSLANMAQADQIVQATLLQFIQEKGLAAINKAKPWGIVLQTDGVNFPVLAAIPVAKPDDLLAVAQANGIQVGQGENGVQQLTLPNGLPAFVKSEGGMSILGQSPESLSKVPANLPADLARVAAEYDIAATVSIQHVPEFYRQIFIQAMRSGMENSLEQRPGETNDQFETRRETATSQLAEIEKTFAEMDELSVGFAVDAQQQRGYLDVVMKAMPGGKLARQVAAYKDTRTGFSGFYRADAAATLTFVNQFDPNDLEADVATMRSTMDAARQQVSDAIDEDENVPEAMREAVKASIGSFFDALLATVATGKLDGAASLQLGPEVLTFVAGAKMKETDKIVDGLKKLDDAVKAQMPGFRGMQWNAAKHGEVAFHTLNVPLPAEADESLRRMIGNELAVAVGIAPEAVYLGVGRDNLASVQQAIDASRAEPNKPAPPFELAVSLGPILDLTAAHATDDNAKRAIQMVAEMLKNDARGRDHIRIVGQIVPNGIRYRFEAEEGALRAVGQAIVIGQMQALGR
jgi:hypothetical protein